jgi:hypothetical protein
MYLNDHEDEGKGQMPIRTTTATPKVQWVKLPADTPLIFTRTDISRTVTTTQG